MKKTFFTTLFLVSILALRAQQGADTDTAWKTIYRATAVRINDLVHTKLEAGFDYNNSYLLGKAWLTLKPHVDPTDSLALDAKGMDIKKVAIVNGTATKDLKFQYDGMLLRIRLDRLYKGGQEYKIYIDYTAKPNELKVAGSSAITDAKGLYFINPKGEEKDKPTQIWTQGETEATSVWVPTIDKPNQKTTQEFFLTVPSRYVSLSNGKLISQKANANGTRTDYWKMDQPHAPYLFFIGIGDYAVVKDSYKGKEVSYYVEKEYAPVARRIFGNTPEMIRYFSRITGVDYPWVKYAQMTARDYVSGAMENTTATLHQEGSQQDARQLVDENVWESTIAHELFHQWFGDYVTAESWSNLTVNESFANYSQVLWNEYKYGKDAADEENYTDMRSYLSSPPDARKHLVRFYYADKEDMFDLVSYQKGGRILHMLRTYVGDSAFFKGLNLYLTANKFGTGEGHKLRIALEEASGKDLNWFFNQWYFGSGHPKLDITYAYDGAGKQVSVTVKQTQSGDQLFKLPVAIDVYNGANKVRHIVWVEQKEQVFNFPATAQPDLVNFDAQKILLTDKKENGKSVEQYIHQYKYAGLYLDRREAIDALSQQLDNPTAANFFKEALKDPYYGLRIFALGKLDLKKENQKSFEALVLDIAKKDQKSLVRARAVDMLGVLNKAEYKSLFEQGLKDSSYTIAGASLEALGRIDSSAAYKTAKELSSQKVKGRLASEASGALIAYGTESDFDAIYQRFNDMPLSQAKFDALRSFGEYLAKVNDTEKFKKGVDAIIDVREAIPASFQKQTTPVINNMILKTLAGKKSSVRGNGNEAEIRQQVDYINEKIK